VTKAEHGLLGHLYIHHLELYEQMLKCRADELPPLGLKRYTNRGVVLRRL